MRRVIAVLTVTGVASVAAAWPLWHVTRNSGCGGFQHPCDPRQYLPFAGPAVVLTVLGVAALLGVVVLLTLRFFVAVFSVDAQERAAAQAEE